MDIKNYILNKYLDIDEILLNYLITYFNYIDTYNLYPSNILLTDIIDTTLTNVRHIIFFDKDSDIAKAVGGDFLGITINEEQTIYINSQANEKTKETTIYHEIHHAAQIKKDALITNPYDTLVGIRFNNLGILINEAQTAYLADSIYQEIHHNKSVYINYPSDKFHMLPGGTIISNLSCYQVYDYLLTKLSFLLELPKEFFIKINYLFELDDNNYPKGLTVLKEIYNKYQTIYNIPLSFDNLMYQLDYIAYMYELTYSNYEEGMYYFSPHTSIPVNFNHQLEMLIMNGLDKVFLTKDLKEKNPEVYKKLSNYTFKNKKVKKLQRNL